LRMKFCKRCFGAVLVTMSGSPSAECVAVTWTPCTRDYCAIPFGVPALCRRILEFVSRINSLASKIWPGRVLSV
jgi:hypothetical protein